MPKIRRQNLPPALLQHLLDRIRQRSIPASQLGILHGFQRLHLAGLNHRTGVPPRISGSE
jgi:hypothetical protein